MGSNSLINEYGNCQNIILGPCLEMTRKLRAQLEAPGADPAVLKQVLSCLRLIARIFYSLNGMGLTEVGSWAAAQWRLHGSRTTAFCMDGASCWLQE